MADYGSFAQTILVGRICGQPRSRDTKKGTKVAWFWVRTKRIYPGDKEPRKEDHRVICFGKKAEYMLKFGRLGRLFHIEGMPHHREWVDNEGKRHSIHEVLAEATTALEPFKKEEAKQPKEKEAEKEIKRHGQPLPTNSKK